MTAAVVGLRPPPLVAALLAGIVVLGIFGALDALVVDLKPFDLQDELAQGLRFPVLFSGGLCLLAAGAALRMSQGHGRLIWLPLSLLFVAAGADELVTIHEHLGDQVSVDWEILYLPVFAILGVLWIAAFLQLDTAARMLWVGGAGGWALALLLEAVAYGGTAEGRAGAGALGGAEELLEMIGTTLLAWAMLRSSTNERDSRGEAPAGIEPA